MCFGRTYTSIIRNAICTLARNTQKLKKPKIISYALGSFSDTWVWSETSGYLSSEVVGI
jgi:hypothetical protein